MAERYLTVEEVALVTGWSIHQIRRRAADRDWGRLGSRPQKYRMSDVVATRRAERHAEQHDSSSARGARGANLRVDGGAVALEAGD